MRVCKLQDTRHDFLMSNAKCVGSGATLGSATRTTAADKKKREERHKNKMIKQLQQAMKLSRYNWLHAEIKAAQQNLSLLASSLADNLPSVFFFVAHRRH